MGTDPLKQFSAVDDAADPGALMGLMDRARGLPGIVQCRRAAREALALAPGRRVLDVGCGLGDVTRDLAAAVSPGGRAVGIDPSDLMLGEAKRRADGTSLPVIFETGDATALAFDDASFDACRTERVLCHVPDPVAALAEMVRVLRPGGRLAVIDIDMENLLLDSDDLAFTRSVLTVLADSLCDGRLGRRLPRLFAEAGLTGVSAAGWLVTIPFDLAPQFFGGNVEHLTSLGGLDPEAVGRWWRDLEARGAAGTFFAAVPMVVVAGEKPT